MDEPLFRKIGSASIKEKQKKANEMWAKCNICPRDCQVNRTAGKTGDCGARNKIVLASYGPHFGEERVLTGLKGSGTIFFMHCNLECVFCQNWDISRGREKGKIISSIELADIMLNLQKRGCHNINLVSPTPYIPLILAALAEACQRGLSIPIVYNCGGYENPQSLQLLEGIVDIYLPDAKYHNEATAKKYSGINKYPQYLIETLREMHRQVGDLKVDENGIAYRGLLIRHLVLPNKLAGTEKLVKLISHEISPNCSINIMEQYHPAYKAREYPDLNRRITREEFLQALEASRREGLKIVR